MADPDADPEPGRLPGEDDPRALPAWDCEGLLADRGCGTEETLPFGWDADHPADLEPLRGLRCLGGSLDLNAEIDGPEDLTALSSLEVVCGNLKIGSAKELRDLTPFASLHTLGGLWLYHLDRLESLAGLEGVASFSGRVELSNMPEFTDPSALAGHHHFRLLRLEALPNLTTLGPLADVEEVDGELIIASIPGLEVLTFSSLREAGWLVVRDNPNLEALDIGPLASAHALGLASLPKLSRVVGTGALTSLQRDDGSPNGLSLHELPSLTELSALRNLATVGPLSISDVGSGLPLQDLGKLSHIEGWWGRAVDIRNTELPSLAGLGGVSTVEGRITIVLNPNLPGDEATAWADQYGGLVHKVGGNLDDPMPGWTECPWRDDDECDAEHDETTGQSGLGLCTSDPEDCTVPTCHDEC